MATSTISEFPNSEKFYENLADKKMLAHRMAVSLSFINKLIAEGLPHYKIGRAVRFNWEEVMVFLRKRRKP